MMYHILYIRNERVKELYIHFYFALSLSHSLEFSLSRYFKRSYQYKLQFLSDIFTFYCKLIVYFTHLPLSIPIAPLERFLFRTRPHVDRDAG